MKAFSKILSAGVLSLAFFPAVTYAAANYDINVDLPPSIVGATVSLTGDAEAGFNYAGSVGQYDVQVDWGDGVIDTTSTVGFVDPVWIPGKYFWGDWSNSHVYASSGTFTVTVKLYHQTPPGAEGSGDATVSFDVTVTIPAEDTLEECTDGTDNDSDTDFDLDDEGCASFRPTLTIVKVVDGGQGVPGDFSLDLSGAATTTVSGNGSGEVVTFYEVGAYSVVETDPGENYAPSYSADCSGTIAAGEDLTCTVTNTFDPATGNVTVNKVVVGGPLDVEDFDLYVGETQVVSGETNEFGVGEYSVTEGSTAGYTASFSGDCPEGVITVTEDADLTCTITNTFATTGTLEVLKDVLDKDEDPVDDSTLFTVTLNGGAGVSFGEGLAALFESLTPGDYTLAEIDLPAGYAFVGMTDETPTVSAGATTTVTVTNRQIGTTGTLTVVKVVDNAENENATKTVEDFQLYVDESEVTSGVSIEVSAGDHTVTEDSFEGYQATWSENCPGGVIAVPAEGDVTCTLTNTWVGTGMGEVVVVKTVEGGELSVEDFDLWVGEASVESGATTSMSVGTYQVTETNVPGYSATFGGACDAEGNVTVVSDETVTCTITNTYTTTGAIEVVKNVVGSDGETDVENSTTFYVRLNGSETAIPVGEGANAFWSGLEVGTYTVTEDESSGFETLSISPEVIEVEAGATTTVTITNRQRNGSGTLVVIKNVVGSDGETDIEFDGSFTIVLDGETGASVGEGAPAIFSGLALGDHAITEIPQDGFELVSIEPAIAVVADEATTTVTVTNRIVDGGDDDDDDDGPRRGSRSGRRGSVLGASTDGEVLGDSTDSCDMYLTDFLRIGWTNSAEQVTRLQTFLNGQYDPDIAVTGIFDQATYDYVVKFQVENTGEVLLPWINLGLHDNANRGTGYVYKTTRWLINRLASPECPGEAPILP